MPLGSVYTGISANIAFVYCIIINVGHFYLTKTSEARHSSFGRHLLVWSHLSMISMTFGALFMIFSYYHPESLITDGDICLCAELYAIAVILFCTGLFLLKINYLVRLNMVLNPKHEKRSFSCPMIYMIILFFEAIGVNFIQYMVIQGECIADGNNSFENGCVATFDEWNGWMATGFLIHDITVYYLFCLYYIRHTKAKINKIKQENEIEIASKPSKGLSPRLEKVIVKLKSPVAGNNKKYQNMRKANESVGSVDHSSSSHSSTSHTSTTSANSSLSSISINSTTSGNNSTENSSNVANNYNNNNPTRKRRTSKLSVQDQLKIIRETKKMEIVSNGLLRQFSITFIAVIACLIDTILNTFLQSYDYLFLFMIDLIVNVTLNFFVFRDSRRMVRHFFKKICKKCCPGCHKKCCKKRRDRSNTRRNSNGGENSRENSTSRSTNASKTSQPQDAENSYLSSTDD